MSSLYMRADERIAELVATAMTSWHPTLTKAGVKIGILFVLSARESQPALKENGHPVEGTIKIVSLKDRVSKGFDVEMLLDGDEWSHNQEPHKLALVDHLLSRLEIRKPKAKKKKKAKGSEGAVHGEDGEREEHEEQEFMMDDIGRPIIKIRKADWRAGNGFREVVERHGPYSVEYRTTQQAWMIVETATVTNSEQSAIPAAV